MSMPANSVRVTINHDGRHVEFVRPISENDEGVTVFPVVQTAEAALEAFVSELVAEGWEIDESPADA